MARQPDVQYIRYYTDGSAARVLAPKTQRKSKTVSPAPRTREKVVLRLDPLAMAGILVCAVMMLLMVVGCFHFVQAQQELVQMYSYVETLEENNRRLSDQYTSGYDLEEVEKSAKALGMIPLEQATTIHLDLPTEQVTVQEETPFAAFWTFLAGLFA